MADKIKSTAVIVKELEEMMQCNCDLDRWEPERTTGHSWVCRIHKEAMQILRRQSLKNQAL